MHPANRPPTAIVFDVFGTLLKIDNPTRPYSVLAQHLESLGADISDFAHRAMTARHTPASLAASYGASVSLEFIAHIDAMLLAELERIEPYEEADRTLRHVLGQGASIVIASNLAWPYALPVRAMLGHLARDRVDGSGNRVSTFFSFDRGLLKPDPSFYQALAAEVLDREGIAPDRIFMLGDKLVEDCQSPTLAGWQAWHLDRAAGAQLLDAPWDAWLGPHTMR